MLIFYESCDEIELDLFNILAVVRFGLKQKTFKRTANISSGIQHLQGRQTMNP